MPFIYGQIRAVEKLEMPGVIGGVPKHIRLSQWVQEDLKAGG